MCVCCFGVGAFLGLLKGRSQTILFWGVALKNMTHPNASISEECAIVYVNFFLILQQMEVRLFAFAGLVVGFPFDRPKVHHFY